jgi:DNA uptake protein ComE-like DNA-binding protein
MKKVLKDFFTFEKRGQKGLFVLVLILSTQLLVLWLLNFYNPLKNTSPNLIMVDPSLLDSLENQNYQYHETKAAEAFNEDIVTFHSYKNEVQRFKFNPNTIDENGWIKLGINKNQIRVITKYLQHGGHFDYPSEVLKIKAVPISVWNELIPYIELEAKTSSLQNNMSLKDSINPSLVDKEKSIEERLTTFRKNLNFEFNTCNRFNLQQLNLIDSVTIDKIIRYKKGLGGFVSLAQLYEMEGIDTTNFGLLKTHLTLDLMSIKTININNCSVSQLSKHPYLSYNVATALVNYRNAHGKYTQISDLKKCMAMNDQLLKKITPYLRLTDD